MKPQPALPFFSSSLMFFSSPLLIVILQTHFWSILPHLEQVVIQTIKKRLEKKTLYTQKKVGKSGGMWRKMSIFALENKKS